MNTKITIIGANSFLARNFIYYLINIKNFNINNIYLYDIQDSFFDQSKHYEKIDLLEIRSMEKINLNVDSVYFFSGITGTVKGFESYKLFVDINNTALLNFLELHKNSKYKPLIVYPSSRLIYKENGETPVKELAPVELKSVYAITKFAAEEYLKLYANCFGINYCILRVCTPFGSLINSDGHYGTFKFFVEQAINNKVITIYGDGHERKTYTHVFDICNILSEANENEKMHNEIFNIGGDIKSLLEIAQIIASEHNATIKHIDWPEIDKKVDGGTVMFDSNKLDNIVNIKYRKIESFK